MAWLEHTFVFPITGGSDVWTPEGWDEGISVDLQPEDIVGGPVQARFLTLVIRVSNDQSITPGACILYELDGDMLEYAPTMDITLTNPPATSGLVLWHYTLLEPSFSNPQGFIPGEEHDRPNTDPLIWTLTDGDRPYPPVPPVRLILDKGKPGDDD